MTIYLGQDVHPAPLTEMASADAVFSLE